MNNASKKVAVVAGVGEGLGQAIARRFATDYHVVMFARDLDKLQGYAQQLREAGGEATGMKVDLRVESEIVEIVPSRSKPDRGVVIVRSTTLNQNGDHVQAFTAKILVFKRPDEPNNTAPKPSAS